MPVLSLFATKPEVEGCEDGVESGILCEARRRDRGELMGRTGICKKEIGGMGMKYYSACHILLKRGGKENPLKLEQTS
jgi:hypothetical protein